MKSDKSSASFQALRSAEPKQPLVGQDELVGLLNRPPAATSRVRPIAVVASVLLVVAGAVWFGTNSSIWDTTQVDKGALPVTTKPLDNTQRLQEVLPPSLNTSATELETHSIPSERIAQPRATKTSKLLVKEQPEKPSAISMPSASATIAGVQYLDLTQQEFNAMPTQLRGDIVTHRVRRTSVDGQVVDTRSIECLLPTTAPPDVTYNGEEFVQRRALFIPVRVSVKTKQSTTETITWFRPTSLLITYLPERYRVPLMMEMNLLSEVQRGCMSPADACKEIQGSQSYFDMCRLDAASIRSVIVSPNPAHMFCTMTVDLLRQTTLNVGLYSSAGNFITDLTARESYEAGRHSLPLRFDGVSAGLYLVTITTTNGEHVVRQVIIE